jgi:tetratricopeptide (TPR) repeat protein
VAAVDDRFQRVEDLFHRAIQRPLEAREAFLSEVCDDAEIRAEVLELLAASDDSDTRLDGAFESLTEPLESSAGSVDRIGPFELGAVIASGGMGTVYEAVQDNPRRSVALKLMRRGFEDPSSVRRFEYESQILAELQHPGIAHVYESGTLREGERARPWFAMELIVDARPITTYADEERLGLEDRIRLVIEACGAVHHGHQKGVIHRDLKPGNVLVDRQGRVKIIDFGVAKATDADHPLGDVQTAADQFVGTPRYMSPEQAVGGDGAIDTRTDVHALGLLLYELLTGTLPYRVAGLSVLDALEVIRSRAPDAGPLRAAGVPEDLRVIVLEAIAKEPERRYESAAALAEDLGRFLRHEPIRARPPSVIYQARKFARRNRLLVASAGAVVLALAAGVVGTSLGLAEAEAQRELAEQRLAAAEKARDEALWEREFLSAILTGASPWDGGALQLSDVIDLAAKRLDGDPPADPAIEGEMRTLLGEVYRKVGALERSEVQLTRAVELLAADSEAGLLARTGLARTLLRRDEGKRAEEIVRAAVAGWEQLHGPDHRETLRARGVLGMVVRRRGRLDEAVDVLETVLARQEATLGPEHPDVDTSRNNLATVLYQQAAYGRAIELYEGVLAHRERTLGLLHPDTITTMSNLAASYAREQRYEDADALYARALESTQKVLGKDHDRTLSTMSNYAAMLRRWGKLDRAEPLSRGAYEARERILGPSHFQTVQSLTNYAALLHVQERYDEAEALFVRGMEAAERRPDATASERITLYSNYATLLRETGRLGEAEPVMRKATELAHEVHAADHWMPWAVQANYGELLVRLERYDDARAALEQAHRNLYELRGADNEYTKSARDRLVVLYEKLGIPDPEAAIRVSRVGG